MESIFEFLFKYRPVVFERGEFMLGSSWPLAAAYLLGFLILLPVLWSYTSIKTRSHRLDHLILVGFRMGGLALLIFMLLRPLLVISTTVPQQNFVGILLDDSRSMSITDSDDRPRGDAVTEILRQGSKLLEDLGDRFKVRQFALARDARRISSAADLTFNGRQTDLGAALRSARQELSGVPLAGLIVVSDGANNGSTALTEELLNLRASGVPIYTIGVGKEHFDKDIEVQKVEAPRSVLKGASLVVDVLVAQTGYAGKEVQLQIEDGSRIVSTRTVKLPEDGATTPVRVQFTVTEPGPRIVKFRVPPRDDETVKENNEQQILLTVDDAREKILYVEGEPRFEVKFIRRALEDDENIRVVVLERTAENKFYRLGVDTKDELVAGFPKTREELFAYRGLILGSVEASFFTHDQLKMIEEFVSDRGGGLLMLGGGHSFDQGGYAGTPVADALPVVLAADPGSVLEPEFAEIKVMLTPFGRHHPVTQIADGLESSANRWSELPPLTTWNPIVRAKPGASILLSGRAVEMAEPLVVLAYERYGKGKSVAFPVQDSWLWQMHADIPVDDMTYETLWRQLLRWLISSVPDQVSVTVSNEHPMPGEAFDVVAEVDDSTYLRVNNSVVTAYITAPSGEERTLPMSWDIEKDGTYEVTYKPEETGLYEIRVEAQKDGAVIGSRNMYLEVADASPEFFGAELKAGLLKRIAAETGGRYYTSRDVGSLPEDITFTESGTTVVEQKPLWNMPVLFFLIILLLGAEWSFRRARGLV